MVRLLALKIPAVTVLLKNNDDDAKDRLAWTWNNGGATSLGDFGDPTSTTVYALCIYDRAAGVPQRVGRIDVAAGAGWSSVTGGFRFKNDKSITLGGISSATLLAGPSGAARIVMKGKAHPLGMPPLPLTQDPSVAVQLVNRYACWGANYGTAIRNETGVFKALSD